MKILYGVQGTGNGHLARARELLPSLTKRGTVDVLVSGTQADITLDHPITHRFYGLSYTFGKHGGIDIVRSIKRAKPLRLLNDIRRLDLSSYDLVITDFEPISAWAGKRAKLPVIHVSHQAAFLHPAAPRPKRRDHFAEAVIRHFAPSTSHLGFHYQPYHQQTTTPLVRRSIRELDPHDEGHYTVYLPSFSAERLIPILREAQGTQWHIFDKHSSEIRHEGDIRIHPVSKEAYVKSIESARGLLLGAGFQATAEALFLQKRLLVVPMFNQYEQLCNAAALEEMGIHVLTRLDRKAIPIVQDWVKHGTVAEVDYPDHTERIVDQILSLP